MSKKLISKSQPSRIPKWYHVKFSDPAKSDIWDEHCQACGCNIEQEPRCKYWVCKHCDLKLCHKCIKTGQCKPKKGGAITQHNSFSGQQTLLNKYKKPDAYRVLVKDTSEAAKAFNQLWNSAQFKDVTEGLPEREKKVQEKLRREGEPTEMAFQNGIHLLQWPAGKRVTIVEKATMEKLGNGDYIRRFGDNNSVSTESKYAQSIKKMITNFPSFKQYKDRPDLSWLVEQPIWLLLKEAMEYHLKKGNAFVTFWGDTKAILKPIKILVGLDSELRYQISVLSQAVGDMTKVTEGENVIQSDREIKQFIPYPDLLVILEGLERKWEAKIARYGQGALDGRFHDKETVLANQNLIAVALFTLDFPSRTDKFKMSVGKQEDELPRRSDNNYLEVPTDPNERLRIIYGYEVKGHRPMVYQIDHDKQPTFKFKGNAQLEKLLRKSLQVYPRDELFFNIDAWVKSKGQKVEKLKFTDKSGKREMNPIGDRLRAIELPDPYKGVKTLGVNGFRSSFVSYWFDRMNKNERDMLVKRMRSSTNQIQTAYSKVESAEEDLRPKLTDPKNTEPPPSQIRPAQIERLADKVPEYQEPIIEEPEQSEPEPEATPAVPQPRSRAPGVPPVPTTAQPVEISPSRSRGRPRLQNPKDPRQIQKEATAKWFSKPENRAKHNKAQAVRQTTDYAYALKAINTYRKKGEDPSAYMIDKYKLKKQADGTWITEVPKPEEPRRNARKQNRSTASKRAVQPSQQQVPQQPTQGDSALANALSLIAQRLGV